MRNAFVADDKFDAVIRVLRKRGWEQLPLEQWKSAELLWRNLSKTVFAELDPEQLVNHLFGAQALSHKASFARLALEDAPLKQHFPACYDLRNKRHSVRFVRHLAATAAASAMKMVLEQEGDDVCDSTVLEACAAFVERFVTGPGDDGLCDSDVDELVTIFGDPKQASAELARSRATGKCPTALRDRLRRALMAFPQPVVEGGFEGVWLVKPAGGSCGLGIECVSSLADAVRLAARARWRVVVQRYVERPLLVRRKKFDLRQWILVTHTSPLTVWGFSQCYVRFAGSDWSLGRLEDRFAHLCNFSVQKDYNAKDAIDEHPLDEHPRFSGSMWHSTDLASYLEAVVRPGAYNACVLPQLKQIATSVARVGTRAGVTKIAHGFEWLGLDILVAENLSAWLLEVNVSPDVSHSTPVTAALVDAATEDAISLLLEHRADRQHASRYALDMTSQGQKGEPQWELWYEEGPTGDRTTHEPAFSYFPESAETMDTWWRDIEQRFYSRSVLLGGNDEDEEI